MPAGAGLELALGGVITAVDALKDTLRETMQFGENAQKASLALGTSLEHTNQELTPTMQGLRGDISERFTASIAGLEVGMQGNTAGLAHLVNQQRLTGTESKKTAMAFAKMESQLGVSREATNALAKNFVQIGDEWMVSTDHLVDAMSALEKSFPAQKLAGMGAEVTQAFASLTAELGPSMKGPMQSVMSMIMDTSMEGYEKLTMLGMEGVREQLSAAKSAEEAQSILKDAIQKGAGTFESVVGDASEGFFQIGVASEIFGESAIQLTAVQDAFGERVAKEGEQAADFGNQLSVIKAEILLPLQQAFITFYPIILDVATVIGVVLKQALTFVIIKALELYIWLGGLSGVVEKAKELWTKFGEIITIVIIPHLIKLGAKLVWVTAKALAGFAIALIGPILGLASFTIGIIAAAAPFWPLIAAVGAIILIIKLLNDKFGFMDPLIEAVNSAYKKVILAMGHMLIELGSYKLVPGFVGNWGRALVNSQSDIEAHAAAVTKDKDKGKKKTQEQQLADLMGAFEKTRKGDRAMFGLTQQIEEHTKKTSVNTEKEIKTSPEFLDETANMLGRSIEGILGVGRDTVAEETLEEMKRIREAAEVSADEAVKSPIGGATSIGT